MANPNLHLKNLVLCAELLGGADRLGTFCLLGCSFIVCVKSHILKDREYMDGFVAYSLEVKSKEPSD